MAVISQRQACEPSKTNKQLEKSANSSHLAGNLKPNLINGFINLVQVPLRKPCVTAKAKEHTQTQGQRQTHTHMQG